MNFNKFILFLLLLQSQCCATISSGVCEHYYASIKASVVNSHVGPGENYQIAWRYVKGVPVVVVAKYDHWRMIVDPSGDSCWIHKSLLSSKRSVICVQEAPAQLIGEKFEMQKVVAFIKKNVIMTLLDIQGQYCFVECVCGGKKYQGWILKTAVFGA